MKRLITFGCMLMLSLAAQAKELTLERIVASPSLSGASITGLKLSPDGRRASYLKGKADNHRQQDLWAYDIAENRHFLLVDSKQLVVDEQELSEVEKARRERMRITGQGIVEYYWSPDSKALLFPLGGDLYYLPLSGKVRRLTNTEAFETDVRFSPKGSYVSFVRDQNLYVIELQSGNEQALTVDGGGAISNAMAEFVAQEEMGRMTGYWWAPNEKRIAFTRIDESGVKLVDRYEVKADGTVTVIPQRYPFAGTDNVQIQLGVMSVTDADKKPMWMDLGREKDIYIARVNWLPDSQTVAFQRQNRAQTELSLLFANAANGRSHTVLTEQSPAWINLNDDLRFLAREDLFIWASERSGFKHLYLMDFKGNVIAPITAGEWAVEQLVGFDEAEGAVYFTANADGVLEQHLYTVPLHGAPEKMRRLTKEAGWHSISYGCVKEGYECTEALFIDQYSAQDTPPKVALRAEDGSLITWMVENPLDETHPYFPYLDAHVALEFGQLKADDGKTLHYQVMKPKKIQTGKKYPAIVHLYGGPHSQLVKNAWNTQWFNQYLVQQGYVVFTIDNRGTFNRGIEFEAVIKGKLGEAEVADQLAGVDYLRSLPFVDQQRIGVWGWSYGGYMTLMSLFKAPDTFAAGASVAPVTDWLLYDTHYTERYMGIPEQPSDYDQAAVFPYIDNYLASEDPGKLLLVHGMADDNVFFDNSIKLMSQLQNKQVNFELMTYPGKKHGIRGEQTRTHLWKMLFDFFEREVKNRDSTQK